MDKALYDATGIHWPVQLYEPDEAAKLYDRYCSFQTEVKARRGREAFIKPHLVSTWLDGIVRHPVVVAAVEAAIGPDILLWESDFFVKAAGKGTYVGWHQDSPYWDLSTNEVVSVWLALTASKGEMGPLVVLPGSHSDGQIGRLDIEGSPHDAYSDGERTADAGNLVSFEHKLDGLIDETTAIEVELEPGYFSVHHVDLVHGGQPNRSSCDRVGFVMRFISSNTYCRAGRDSATLISGRAPASEHFVLEPRPSADYTREGLAALEAALAYPSGFGDKPLK
ncbi:phytanoyl-CoA dioxygenase family protein [Pelagibius sp. Alg239-R121]|uniref:phytanoyl-CoA dioxygenase family protein n=1 Tax=Pelagibius sp. Alg239-R121 TaxID=2993448 RepID=UPI0024A7A420|nr:phytanoyl-CoA dioxygenase family protein [Pelagibius sp. Alg239-R121]